MNGSDRISGRTNRRVSKTAPMPDFFRRLLHCGDGQAGSVGWAGWLRLGNSVCCDAVTKRLSW